MHTVDVNTATRITVVVDRLGRDHAEILTAAAVPEVVPTDRAALAVLVLGLPAGTVDPAAGAELPI